MAEHTRRDFLKTTGAGALAVGLGGHAEPPATSGGAPTTGQGPSAGADPQSGAGQGRPPTGNLGTVVWRGDPDYEATRRRMVWNQLLPARFPEVIVTVASDQDVVEAVKLARARGLKISVRSGGHSWIGSSLRDGGMLIDLSRLNNVTVDAAARTAAAQPAIMNTEVMAALAPYDLAFPTGHCPSVALGGYLLSGGQGWNQGIWGPACQNVLAIDYVNADGEPVTTDAQRDPELFWLARGVGPGFPGVITRYHLRLYPRPRAISQSTYVYPLDQLEGVVPWLRQTVPSLPPNLEQLLLMALPPPHVASLLPDPTQRYLTLWPVVYGDSMAENAAALAPLDTSPVLDRALVRQFNTPVTFDDLFAIEDAVYPKDHRYDVEIMWSDSDPVLVMSRLRERLARCPSLKTIILIAVTGPSSLDPAGRDMSYSMAAPLYVGCWSTWENAADDEANVRWQQETVQSLAPFTVGHYMGETNLLAAPNRGARSFGPGVWERVQAVTRRYDPQGLFFTHIGQA
jgi:FAD/FMN-containing dehydrogenase